jgi:hypothetical protein
MTAKKQEEGRDAGVSAKVGKYRGLVRDFYSFDRLDTLFGHSIT